MSNIKEFKKHIKKYPVPGAGEVLKNLNKNELHVNDLINELEAYVERIAFDKETGLPWNHWLEHTRELIDKIQKERSK
jgi:hypothetical protein